MYIVELPSKCVDNHSRQPGADPRESLFCRGQKATMPVVL